MLSHFFLRESQVAARGTDEHASASASQKLFLAAKFLRPSGKAVLAAVRGEGGGARRLAEAGSDAGAGEGKESEADGGKTADRNTRPPGFSLPTLLAE